MIEERDVEDVASFAELVRLVDVGHARGGCPARVVVEEDDCGGIRQQRFLDDSAVVDRGRLDGPDGDHLLGQRKVGRVEKEDPGLLVVEGPEVFPEESGCLGRSFDRGVGCVVCLLTTVAGMKKTLCGSLQTLTTSIRLEHRTMDYIIL